MGSNLHTKIHPDLYNIHKTPWEILSAHRIMRSDLGAAAKPVLAQYWRTDQEPGWVYTVLSVLSREREE